VRHAQLTIDPAFRVAEVDPRVYGSFVEHLGRCVYEGIYEPSHPSADPNGFRSDVKNLVRELGTPILRYPGGNFVSGYDWEDSVGPRDQRPTRLELAWRSLESNHVGVDEFVPWARDVGSDTMMAINLGTRGVDAARNIVEYCNHPSGTQYSDLRRSNGAAQPHDIKLWCLGNEMDGPWQIGHKTATEYGRLALESGKAMRLVDPSIELVACGSSHPKMPTFGSWESTVLEEAYEVTDYISLHSYYEQHGDDRASFLASAVEMDRFIDSVVATCDHVRAVGRHKKRINLSFDEWNVWFQSEHAAAPKRDWQGAPPLIEDTYSVTDAVVVGNLLMSLLRRADRVKIGCLAQLVNVIAPIKTELGGPAWRQASFHPFALTSRHARGTVLRVEPTSPVHDTAMHGEVPLVDAVAVLPDEGGGADSVVLLAVNRDESDDMVLDVDLRALPGVSHGQHLALWDADPAAVNSKAEPDRVRPRPRDDVKVVDGHVEIVLPPLSWNIVRLGPQA
jgi:alpha-N-arabinofuranosidase